MSYLVLARKWRPQKFKDIVGQEFVRKTLQNAISSGRVAHAFLFSGARGVGKTSTARILAKSLNCKDGPTVEPCNVCENCKEISNGNAIDVFEIDGASNRGIDEIRELRESIKYFPSKSKHKIYIVDEVHMLTKEAFNALLKTLEEPPAHVVFIFATTEPHKIPITILSRCQRFDFKKILLKDIFARLRLILDSEGIKISEQSVTQIAKAANGSMRDAQSVLDQVISYGGTEISDEEVNNILGVIDSELTYSLISAVLKKDAAKALKVISRVHEFGYDINQFCFNLLEGFRDVVAYKVATDPKEVIELSDSELDQIKGFASEFEVKELLLLHNILYRAEEDITKSLNPKILLEMAVLKMINRFPIVPLDTLMKRLESLEKKLIKKGGVIDEPVLSGRPVKADDNVAAAKEEPAHVVKSAPAGDDDESEPEKPKEHALKKTKSSTKEFLNYIKAEDIVLYSKISSLNKFTVEDDEIIIIADNDFSAGTFKLEETKERLNKFANEYYKRKFKITIKTVEKKGENSVYSKRSKSKTEMILDGEHSDPLFSKAKDIFDGEIIDFKFSGQ